MKSLYMPNKLGLFYVIFLSVPLNILWGEFIIVHVTLPTPSHQVTSKFMLAFKMLFLKLLNIMPLLSLKVVLGDHPTRLKTISTIFKSKLSKSTLTETKKYCYPNCLCTFKTKYLSAYSPAFW